jgi:hypothetical protein
VRGEEEGGREREDLSSLGTWPPLRGNPAFLSFLPRGRKESCGTGMRWRAVRKRNRREKVAL